MNTNNCSVIEEFMRMISSSNDPSYLLKIWDELQYSYKSFMMNEKGQTALIKYGNKLISYVDSERKGLMLLNTILLSCSTSLVMENASSWITMCINPSAKEVSLKLKLLSKLLRICNGKPEFDKIINSLMGKIIDTCISINLNEIMCNDALDTLYVCLEKYPSICGPFYVKLEKYTHKYFTVQLSPTILKKAGNVFHMLQQAGGLPATHRSNWSNQISKLCVTVHKLYDRFFIDINEFDSYHDFNVVSEYEFLNNKNCTQTIDNTSIILRNILIFMKSMLMEGFPTEKVINVAQIVDVIKRGLLVDIFQEANVSLKRNKLVALLYELHINLFNLLRSLIACFKQGLFRFISRITKLIMDCLKRTQKDYFKNRSDYQKAVYKTLKLWISITKNKLPSVTYDKIISIILTDITPVKSKVVLRLNENLSRKKRKVEVKNENILLNANETELPQYLLDTKVTICVQALDVGCMLLQQCVLKLDQTTYQTLFGEVIKQLIEIQNGKALHPYNNLKCQMLLYEMLVALFMQSYYCKTDFLHTGINIFTKGQNTINNKISNICNEGLNMLEKLCQAPNPTLCINSELDETSSFRHPDKSEQIINTNNTNSSSLNDLEINSENDSANTSINEAPELIEETCILEDSVVNENVSNVNDNNSNIISIESEEIEEKKIDIIEHSPLKLNYSDYKFLDEQAKSETSVNSNKNNLKRSKSEAEDDELNMLYSFKDIVN